MKVTKILVMLLLMFYCVSGYSKPYDQFFYSSASTLDKFSSSLPYISSCNQTICSYGYATFLPYSQASTTTDYLNRTEWKNMQKESLSSVEDYVAKASLKKSAKEKKISNLSPVIVMETTEGVIEITLKPSIAPKACENFVKLAEKKYYDGLTFHRIIKDFMIQGGDPKGTGTGGESIWGKPFEDEFSSSAVFDKPGMLGMANSGPHTNGSQFFITTAATSWLNKRHTIFGEVTKGYDVVQKLEKTETDRMDKPKKVQKIIKMYVKKD